MHIAALVVAAGRGARANPDGTSQSGPKQYVRLGSDALLAHTLRPLLGHDRIEAVCVVIHADDRDHYALAVAPFKDHPKLLEPTIGGAERQQSVNNGLESLHSAGPQWVMIHDAARPFVTPAMLTRLMDAAAEGTGAILATALSDTLKRCAPDGSIRETVPRTHLWRAETPQMFRFQDILGFHRKARDAGKTDFTDDASLAEWAGLPVRVVESGGGNAKITLPEDIAMADLRMRAAAVPDIRTGQGFDVHRFKTGDSVWLCGVNIPHDMGVDAHSDGDVGLHALTDALLGTIADGDIGVHFRNDDARWKDASSDRFVLHARDLVAKQGGTVTNIDITLLCEAPKVSKHRDAMRARMAALVGIDIGRVSVKATTTETMGFTGRREGLAAMALVTVVFP